MWSKPLFNLVSTSWRRTSTNITAGPQCMLHGEEKQSTQPSALEALGSLGSLAKQFSKNKRFFHSSENTSSSPILRQITRPWAFFCQNKYSQNASLKLLKHYVFIEGKTATESLFHLFMTLKIFYPI